MGKRTKSSDELEPGDLVEYKLNSFKQTCDGPELVLWRNDDEGVVYVLRDGHVFEYFTGSDRGYKVYASLVK
jgi:hypothetical protein